MLLKEITISRGVTINLGNYESTRVEVSLTASIADTANQGQAIAELSDMVNDTLESEIMDMDIPQNMKLKHIAMLNIAK